MSNNRKISKYKIIDSRDQEELERRVNNKIDFGWEPFGNLTILTEPSQSGNGVLINFYQPIIMYEEIE